MPWGSRATSAVANSRAAPGTETTERYFESIVSRAYTPGSDP